MDLIEQIRTIAHKAAEDYLVSGIGMNETILSNIDEDSNSEIIKRICELANQNVYLSIFNDKNTDKGSISFDMANSDEVISALQQSESAMDDYKVDPNDFRNSLEIAVMSPIVEPEAVMDGNEKVATLHEISDTKQSFEKLLRSVETMKFAEYKSMESSFNQIERDTKAMVHNGDSIGDIAKIAMLSIDADKNVRMKIASIYNEIASEMKKSGFIVKEEITKISSLTVNRDSAIVRPAREFALSLQKYAAFNEMAENLKTMISLYSQCEKEIDKL
jgi:hypothetical protein